MNVAKLGRGYAWLDTGTPDALIEAGTFVQTLEKRQGIKISSPEEIAFQMGFISREALTKLGEGFGSSEYGKYLRGVAAST